MVDILNGIDNTISNPATVFQVNPTIAARAGFTPEEVAVDASAILEGEPAATPIIANDIAYTIRVRYPESNRSSLDAMSNTLLNSSTGHTATLGSLATVSELPGQTEVRRENLQRDVTVTARLEGTDLGSAITAVQKTVAGMHLPSSIRVVYGGTYEEQQKSFHDLMLVLVLAVVLVFVVLLFEFRTLAAPLSILASALLSTSGVFLALLITRTDFNIASFMGLIMVIGIVAKNGILLLDADRKVSPRRTFRGERHDPGRTPPSAPHSNDRARGRGRHVAPRTGAGCRFADAATSGHRRDRRSHDLSGSLPHHHSDRPLLLES